jgi:hypothetical protein
MSEELFDVPEVAEMLSNRRRVLIRVMPFGFSHRGLVRALKWGTIEELRIQKLRCHASV